MTLPEQDSPAQRGFTRSSTNLPVVEEDAAVGEVAALYERFRRHFGRPHVADIAKCFATHTAMLRSMMDLAENLLFVEGHLLRRHTEMIATYVSAQNACEYCADSHGFSFCMYGGSDAALQAIQTNDMNSAELSKEERSLLVFVDKITRSSQAIRYSDVEELVRNGWTDLQIAEAVHIAALFAAFNRIANSFGLKSQGLLAGR
jgi:uncharacterized peroxidase-related enzyme